MAVFTNKGIGILIFLWDHLLNHLLISDLFPVKDRPPIHMIKATLLTPYSHIQIPSLLLPG